MIISKNLILSINESKNIDEVLGVISQKLVDLKFATDFKLVLDGFKNREKQGSTGLQDGIAIPHVSSKAIKEAKIIVVKLKKPVDWKSLDGKPVDFVIAIAVPENSQNKHFELLTAISSKLADPSFLIKFKKSTNDEIVNTLTNIKSNEKKSSELPTKENKNSLKIVGVTTCVTGVAHTFMAAQALEDEGRKRGWEVKIERQGQMTKNKLTANEIKQADFVIFGISKQIDNPERFNGKKCYTVEVAEPITKAKKVMDELVEKATIQKGSGNSEVSAVANGKNSKASIMSHMMAGISFMIPYIAMAGIVLGLTTAFGFSFFSDSPNYAGNTGFQPKSPFANALNTLANGGFTLYIPILAMFIANSIDDRRSMAPAAILALVLNTAPDTGWLNSGATATLADGVAPFFNYHTGGFYGWEHSPALGFLGAIASGYLIGYGVKYFALLTDKVEWAPFQALVPLLIIPIVFTVIPWFFMAFIGYIPLYAISLGLNEAVEGLIDINMLWLAGGLMGAMICFDLGGPVNKIAMVIGSMMLSQGTSEVAAGGSGDVAVVNGVCAVAVSIPPMVLFFSTSLHKFTPIKMDEQDITAGWTASVMGLFGITEGSIPFAAKDPKKWMPSFMIAGFVGGALAPTVGVVDNVPMWGGPIIWAAGGYGTILGDGIWQSSNWTYTMLYFIPLIVAGVVGFVSASVLEYIYSYHERKKVSN